MEASSPQSKDQFTTVLTPPLTVRSQKRCLIFWYHMWGRNVGNLNVLAEYRTPTSSSKCAQLLLF